MGINPKVKERLEKQGTWQPFHAERKRLILDGMEPALAHEVALKKYDQPQVADRASKPFVAGYKTAEKIEERRVPRSVFEGKECTYREEVEWVAKNIEIRGVKPEDAPSSSAWGLLKFARSSPTNLMYFWKDFYAKLNTLQAKDDEEGPFKDDGRQILDTIEVLKRGATRGGKGNRNATE